MSRFVLSLLVSLAACSAFAEDRFAAAFKTKDDPGFYCFETKYFHDPLITICNAVKGNATADAAAAEIAKNFGVSKSTARELGAAAMLVFAYEHDDSADAGAQTADAEQRRLTALIPQETKRAPIIYVMCTLAAHSESRAAALEPIRKLLRNETSAAAYIESVNTDASPETVELLLGDAFARWPDDAELIDTIGEATYNHLANATFGPIAIAKNGAHLRTRTTKIAADKLAHRVIRQLDAINKLALPTTLLTAYEALPAGMRAEIAEKQNGGEILLAVSAAEVLAGRTTDAIAHANAVTPKDHEEEQLATKHLVLAAASGDRRDPFDLAIEAFSSMHGGPTAGVPGRLFATLLETGGYQKLAGEVLAGLGLQRSLDRSAPTSRFAAQLEPLRTMTETALDADRARIALLDPPTTQTATLSKLLEAKRIVPFTERALPVTATGASVTVIDCSDAARVAATTNLPSFVTPIRIERRGQEVVAIGISSAVDPIGEIGLGGYWVLRSQDGGNSWREYYTGLRQNMPYVVVPASRLPLLANDRLQIEVEVKELDTTSITFPPVDLRLLRSESGRYLDFPIAELTRDSDGDGVTDLLEEHLAMNPQNADTDGDGADDGHDPLPQVAFNAFPSPEADILRGALAPFNLGGGRIVTGIADEKAAAESSCDIRTSLIGDPVLFVVADRAMFAPMAIDRRVVVLSEEELEAYTKKFGPTYAARIAHFVIDRSGTRAILELNQSWTGVTWLLKKTKDGWVIAEALTNWIS